MKPRKVRKNKSNKSPRRTPYKQYEMGYVKAAYEMVKAKGMSVYRAAKTCGVPQSTLRDRVSGRISIDSVKTGPPTLLTSKEEKQLIDYIKLMTSVGYDYTYSRPLLLHLASDSAHCLGRLDLNRILRDKWYQGFSRRWPEVKIPRPPPETYIDSKTKAEEVVRRYFQELDNVLYKHNLKNKPNQIFLFEETVLSTEHNPPKVVGARSICSVKANTITINSCGNAAGDSLPPYIIFPGKKIAPELLDGAIPGTQANVSESGRSNGKLFQKYIKEHFQKHVQMETDGTTAQVLMLYDGYKNYFSPVTIEWAKKHNIILFVIPPFTSHFVQCLENRFYIYFESLLNQQCKIYVGNDDEHVITRYEICRLVSSVYAQAMASKNLKTAFKRTGVCPFKSMVIEKQLLALCDSMKKAEKRAMVERKSNPNRRRPARRAIKTEVDTDTSSDEEESDDDTSSEEIDSSSSSSSSEDDDDNEEMEEQDSDDSDDNKNGYQILTTEVPQEHLGMAGVSVGHMISSIMGVPIPASDQMTVSAPGYAMAGPSNVVAEEVIVETSDRIETEFETEEIDEVCCVCHQMTPKPLEDTDEYVTWAQCDNPECKRWCHLKYCSSVSEVENNILFFCPLCEERMKSA